MSFHSFNFSLVSSICTCFLLLVVVTPPDLSFPSCICCVGFCCCLVLINCFLCVAFCSVFCCSAFNEFGDISIRLCCPVMKLCILLDLVVVTTGSSFASFLLMVNSHDACVFPILYWHP